MKIVNKKAYKEEIRIIQSACSVFGGIYQDSTCDYELGRYKSENGDIIFYEHRTSAGNHHIRLRVNKINNLEKIIDVVMWLQRESGNNCTFSVKNVQAIGEKANIERLLRHYSTKDSTL